MSEAATDRSDLTVVLGDVTPAEPCAVCERFTPANRELSVRPVYDSDAPPLARAAACEVCVVHYGVAVRLWPDVCDWVPLAIFDDCQCETRTGQIEFRVNAGTDF